MAGVSIAIEVLPEADRSLEYQFGVESVWRKLLATRNRTAPCDFMF